MSELESLRALRRACERWEKIAVPFKKDDDRIRAALRACEGATPEGEAKLLEKIADLTENGERLKAVADSAAEHARDMVAAVADPLRTELSAARAEVERLRRVIAGATPEGWRLASEPPDSGREVFVWVPGRLNTGMAAIGEYLNGSWSPRYTPLPISHWRDIEPPTP